MAKDEEQFDNVKVVYVGKRTASNGKAMHAFATLAHVQKAQTMFDVVEKNTSIFGLKGVESRVLIVGGIYDIEGKIEGDRLTTGRFGKKTFTGDRFDNSELVAFWELQTDTANSQSRMQSQLDKLKKDKRTSHELAALRRMWLATSPPYRHNFEMAVVKALRGA